jgi:hypothetical protein
MEHVAYRPFNNDDRTMIAKLIEEEGFAPTFIARSCGIPGFEDVPCGYYSTIGLSERGWPELVTTGIVPLEDLEMIVNAVVSYWETYGVTLGIIEMLPTAYDEHNLTGTYGRVNITPVIGEFPELLHGNERYYGIRKMVQYYQIVWSDEDLILPNEEGYDENLHQPILTGTLH